jgi:hypothetical protein
MEISGIGMKRILATAAVLFLLLRPVCDVLAAGAKHDERGQEAHAVEHQDARGASAHEHDVPCCADVEDGAVAKPSEPARVAGESRLAFAAPAWTVVRSGTASADARHPPGILITAASFYARSARIRR